MLRSRFPFAIDAPVCTIPTIRTQAETSEDGGPLMHDNRTSVVDYNGHATYFTYDALNRRSEKVVPCPRFRKRR